MRRRALLALLLPAAARAQPRDDAALVDPPDAPPQAAAVPDQPEPTAIAADTPPAPPAEAPPDPVRLPAEAPPARPAPASARPPPEGAEALEGGALRFRLAAGAAPDATQRRSMEELGRRLAALPGGRVTVEAQVSGHPRDHSLARRESLVRAQAAKAALVAGGLDATRIDLRPLGRLDPPADLVDILPPGARSTTAAR